MNLLKDANILHPCYEDIQISSKILKLIVLFTEITQIGVINAVNKMNKIEIPSIPNLNFIKPLIHANSSTNWKSDDWLSNEYHKNKVIKKLTKLVKIDI